MDHWMLYSVVIKQFLKSFALDFESAKVRFFQFITQNSNLIFSISALSRDAKVGTQVAVSRLIVDSRDFLRLLIVVVDAVEVCGVVCSDVAKQRENC